MAKTFSRWFQKAFNFAEFNSKLIDQVTNSNSKMIAAFDSTFEKKSGKKTWGLGRYWNGSASSDDAIKKLFKKEGTDNQEDPTRVDFYLSVIVKHQAYIKRYTNYLAGDGFFTKKKFVDGVVDLDLHLIGKLRSDANLKILYQGPKIGRGRPKMFAGKCNIEKLDGFEFVKDLADDDGKLYVGTFYHASLKRIIKVAAVRAIRSNKVGTALFFSTDLSLSAQEILQFYRARFQIEFIFRDAKQFTRFGDCQSRNEKALNYASNTSLAALNVIKVQEVLQCHETKEERGPFSMASWKARIHNKILIERVFSMSGLDLGLIKSNPEYQNILNYGTMSFREC